MDIVDKSTSSMMMSAVRSKNTKPELIVRKYLFAKGFRYRLHRKDVPGNPDIVLPKYQVCINVNGCFWHMHSGCIYGTGAMPKSNIQFWENKLQGNKARDEMNVRLLLEINWRVAIVWECIFKSGEDFGEELIDFIISNEKFIEIPNPNIK